MKYQLTDVHSKWARRIVVNPNRATKKDASWTVLGIEDFPATPSVGDRLVAVQPDDDGDWVSSARVTEVDAVNGLVYAAVDWLGFSLESKPDRVKATSRFVVFHHEVSISSPAMIQSNFTSRAA